MHDSHSPRSSSPDETVLSQEQSRDQPLIDLPVNTFPTHTPARDSSGSADDQEEDDDNLSLGSLDKDQDPNGLPPTYDLATILGNHASATTAINGTTGQPTNGASHDTSREQRTFPRSGPLPAPGALPAHLPSTAEMENLPNDVVALILETLTVLELYDLHGLSDRWRQLTTRALLHKFAKMSLVLWMDQEGHRAFRPRFIFDSYDEATNRVSWVIRPTSKPEGNGQVFSKTFGVTKPVLRIISTGDSDKYDYLEKEAYFSVLKPGTRTLLGSDMGCPWVLVYKVSSFTRGEKKINGERWLEPMSFECHLNFLNPRRAHKLKLLWYLQKAYNATANASRAKVEGTMPADQKKKFFDAAPQQMGAMPVFR